MACPESGRRAPHGARLPHHRTYRSVSGGSFGALWAPWRPSPVTTTHTTALATSKSIPGVLSACRGRMTLPMQHSGDAVASAPHQARFVDPLCCVSPDQRTHRSGWLLVFGLHHRAQAATTASADFCPPQTSRSPRVRRVTFAPSTRRIYARRLRVTIGLRAALLPRPASDRLVYGSCSSGRSFASSFLPTSPHDDAVALG